MYKYILLTLYQIFSTVDDLAEFVYNMNDIFKEYLDTNGWYSFIYDMNHRAVKDT